jgi:hypothetical protein
MGERTVGVKRSERALLLGSVVTMAGVLEGTVDYPAAFQVWPACTLCCCLFQGVSQAHIPASAWPATGELNSPCSGSLPPCRQPPALAARCSRCVQSIAAGIRCQK